MRPLRPLTAGLALALLSCGDQGQNIPYLEILDVSPAPSAQGVDKAAPVIIHLDRDVEIHQAYRIRFRYLDGNDPVNAQPRCGLTPGSAAYLSSGPFLWKPGRTVEVTVPRDISDPGGTR